MASETDNRLMLSELRYRKLFETAKDGILLIDPKTEKIIDANPFLLELIRYSKEEIIGKELWEIGAVKDIAYAKMMFEELKTKGYVRYEDIPIKSKDGQEHEVEFVSNQYPIGATEMIQCNIRDITDRKALDRARDEFIAIASHQLRTPLTSIQWVVERFLKKENLTPQGRDYLNDIHLSTMRLSGMVDLLLNLSRIEGGQAEMTPESLEVVAFVKSFLDEVVPLSDKKELRILFEDHPTELVATIDKSALRTIVQNLVSNAIEYTPNGGSVTVAIQKKEADRFVITVRDTGIGIPLEEQPHVFEKFARATNAKLYKTDGIGIGLYIAERTVNHLGGKIWFESEKDKGSTFSVELPLGVIK